MISWIEQARRVISAGLFLFILAACSQGKLASPTTFATAALTATPVPTHPLVVSTPVPLRSEVEIYEVQGGDTLSNIAQRFDINPETVLWANYDQLLDDPDFLFPGMQLTILPVDGIYHQVGGGETLLSIANFFEADIQAVRDWPDNHIGPGSDTIFNGQWLMVPGGQRALRRRMIPNLRRTAMAVSFEEYGSGACPQNVSGGAQGDGVYAWPVEAHKIGGDGFWSAHPAIDIAAEIDEEIHAADDGVVVFSGWSNFGYGNMVMLDHGSGEFSLYAGLVETVALCGHSVSQGEVIGIAGASGHSAGPYVHFEIRRGDEFLDPLAVMP